MKTIEEEIAHVVAFLSHPAGFDVSMADLHIRPIYSTIDHWQVDWQTEEDGMICNYHKIFPTLEEAAECFVEKRRYMCIGLDFNQIYAEESKEENV